MSFRAGKIWLGAFGAVEVITQFYDSIAGEKPHIVASTSVVIWGMVGYFTARDEVCAFISFLLIINEPNLSINGHSLFASIQTHLGFPCSSEVAFDTNFKM